MKAISVAPTSIKATGVKVPFKEIVGRHGPTVFRVCRAVLGPVDAEDAWPETFLSALRAYPTFAPTPTSRRGWSRLHTVRPSTSPEPPPGVRTRPRTSWINRLLGTIRTSGSVTCGRP
ncbi:MAG: sigma factor [Nocardioidaceae bacterium]